MKIEDNFLEQKDFDELQVLMMGPNIAWYFNDGIDYGIRGSDGKLTFSREGDRKKFQFTHNFFEYIPCSDHFKDLVPFVKKIAPLAITRIKANLLTRTPEIIKNEFHTDISDISEEKLKQLTTSVFYVNTNNGYTKFEDGTKVESVANRLVTFPSNLKHHGTSCTDEKTRVVINFNYFK